MALVLVLALALAATTWLSLAFPLSAPAQTAEPMKDSGKDSGKELGKDSGKFAFKTSYQKGAKLFQEKKYQAAAANLTVAAQSPADDGEAGILLGYCFYEMHQYQKALDQYKKVSETGKLISVKNRAQRLAATLNSYMKGICPGNCLKPSTPGWRKMDVPGKPDRLVWMVFPYLDPAGKGGSEYWSNDHMGEVIEYVNGRPINKGPCPLCSGTGKVSLPK
jgi:tetratricopeptide (TPR) repeat protein